MIENNKDKKEIVVGVDIGGTNTVYGLVDFNNNVLLEDSFKTMPEKGADDYFERLSHEIKKACNKYHNKYELNGIGIAAPGADYLKGSIDSAANLKWGKVNFTEIMSKHFLAPVVLINDANAAALGEKDFGLAKDYKNFMVITLGTGLGAGIVVNGRLLYGENSFAGEFGHAIVKRGGRQCNCGRQGCLETYVSANGIRRTVLTLLGHFNEDSALRRVCFEDITSKMIYELAIDKDPIALKAFNFTGEILGRALSNVVTSFDPGLIVLTGGLAEAEGLILNPTIKYFEESLLHVYKDKVKILKSVLQNGRAAVLGSASFAREMLCKEILKVI